VDAAKATRGWRLVSHLSFSRKTNCSQVSRFIALRLSQKPQAVVFAFMRLVTWVMDDIDYDMNILTNHSLWLA
jgi:hypothetical protein